MTFHVDSIYDYSDVSDQFSAFIDVSSVSAELSRLKNLKQLGLTHFIFPQAEHSMYDHHLGLFCLLSLLESNKNIPTDLNYDCIKYAALIHGIGHFPLGKGFEKHLILLMHIDENYKKYILNYLHKTIDYCISNNILKQGDIDITIKNIDYNYLYRLFTAHKLLRLRKDVDLSNSFSLNLNNVLSCLLQRDSNMYHAFSEFDKIDYILRDLYHVNLFYPKINIRYYMEQVSFSKLKGRNYLHIPPELYDIMQSIYIYAEKNIYYQRSVKLLHSYVGHLLFDIISQNYKAISIDNLLLWTDSEFLNYFHDNCGISINDISMRIKSGDFRDYISFELNYRLSPITERRKTIFAIERRHLGIKKKTYLYLFKKDGILSSSEYSNYSSTYDADQIAMRISTNIKTTNIRRLAAISCSLHRELKSRIYQKKEQILRYFLGSEQLRINNERYDKISRDIWRKLFDTAEKKKVENIEAALNISITSGILPLIVKEIGYEDSYRQLVHEMTKKMLLREMERIPRETLKKIKEMQFKTKEKREIFKEICIIIDRLLIDNIYKKKEKYDFILVANSVTITKPQHEIDAVVIYYRNNRSIIIDLIEVSTQKSIRKQNEEHDKLLQVRRKITEVFGRKVIIRLFYNDIKLDN